MSASTRCTSLVDGVDATALADAVSKTIPPSSDKRSSSIISSVMKKSSSFSTLPIISSASSESSPSTLLAPVNSVTLALCGAGGKDVPRLVPPRAVREVGGTERVRGAGGPEHVRVALMEVVVI